MAVFPSADNAMPCPWSAAPTAPVPTSLAPCWLHTPPLRVYTHAAPALPLSRNPPTMAVFPSADTSEERRVGAAPTSLRSTCAAPCFHNTPLLVETTHAAAPSPS